MKINKRVQGNDKGQFQVDLQCFPGSILTFVRRKRILTQHRSTNQTKISIKKNSLISSFSLF